MPVKPNEAAALVDAIKSRARQLGFDLVGIAPAEPSRHRAFLRQWLDEGRAGEMHWLTERFNERADVRTYMPGAASVICVAVNYNAPLPSPQPSSHPRPSPWPSPGVPGEGRVPGEGGGAGRIARYALGDDYHDVLKTKLHALADWLRERVPAAATRACGDTSPVLERELSARAGVGWVGKNTCIINEQIGSWLLLGEIVTTLELPPDQPAADRCGTCRRCIDACPTAAIVAPYQLDPRRCISYLTIEHRGEIAADLRPLIGDWLFGCDICQEVCPWNTDAPISQMLELRPRFPSASLDVDEVLSWRPEQYQRALKGSAMKRVKLPILQRNAGIVKSNSEAFLDHGDHGAHGEE